MAKKGSQSRLTVPKDIWDIANFGNYSSQIFGFFIFNDSRVVIEYMEIAQNLQYQFIGKCNFDEKHRFFIPKNVDTYLGNGDTYYFSTFLSRSGICIYKLDPDIIKKRQCLELELLIASV